MHYINKESGCFPNCKEFKLDPKDNRMHCVNCYTDEIYIKFLKWDKQKPDPNFKEEDRDDSNVVLKVNEEDL